MSSPRTAVVLFNLGGPDSREAIKPFLINFFSDPNIIQLPQPFRGLLARVIAGRRSRREAGDSYSELGDKSPLLENTRTQEAALQDALAADPGSVKVFTCMRYWHPMAREVVRDVKAWGAERIVLLPLYPQFSTTTTWSSIGEWQKAVKLEGLQVPTSLVCCYPRDAGFIDASARLVREAYDRASAEAGQPPRVLFSAHGLPEKIIRQGDPYQWQCEEGARLIAKATGIDGLDWQICYQSRVGPLKWIGPSTEEALEKAAADGVPVLVYPHAFVSEHVETLVEIEIEYREMAEEMGVVWFGRVPTVMTAPEFISGLARLVRERVNAPGISSDAGGRICPSGAKRCCQNMGLCLTGMDQPLKVAEPQAENQTDPAMAAE